MCFLKTRQNWNCLKIGKNEVVITIIINKYFMWINTNNIRILQQSQLQSCGYCCVGMAIKIIENVEINEEAIVATGIRIGGQNEYDRATRDRIGFSPTVFRDAKFKAKVEHWGSGTYGRHLAAVLQEYSIDAVYQNSDVKTAMRNVTPNKPIIVLVLWNPPPYKKGGHWVLVTKRITHFGKSSNYEIMDPGGNLVDNIGSTTYRNAKNIEGTFVNHYVQIRGRLNRQAVPKIALPGLTK
jgi:hypothetical protein